MRFLLSLMALTMLVTFVAPSESFAQYYRQRVTPQRRIQPPPRQIRPQYVPRPQAQQRVFRPQLQERTQQHVIQGRQFQQRGAFHAAPQRQQRMFVVRQRHFDSVHGPVRNRLTGAWGPRLGRRIALAGVAVAASRYAYVWCSSLEYDGAAYVELPGVGFVEFDNDDRYPGIVADLSSGDPERIEAALALVEGSAMMQGLMDMPESDGD